MDKPLPKEYQITEFDKIVREEHQKNKKRLDIKSAPSKPNINKGFDDLLIIFITESARFRRLSEQGNLDINQYSQIDKVSDLGVKLDRLMRVIQKDSPVDQMDEEEIKRRAISDLTDEELERLRDKENKE